MDNNSYLSWVLSNTATTWWHDSGDPRELDLGIRRGSVGVTTNPVLSNRAIRGNVSLWNPQILEALSAETPGQRAEALMKIVVTGAAVRLLPEYRRSGGQQGYVCAQVDPSLAGDRKAMIAAARRFHAWAPNIAVKLPVTAAGLEALEACTSEGITVTATVSFTVPQVVAIAESYRRGLAAARRKKVTPGRCFAVIMIGRIDDYLRDVAHDNGIEIPEEFLRQAGLAITKRAYSIYKENMYEAVLIIAALRGSYHMTELAGGELIMSIHPRYQEPLLAPDIPKEERIRHEIKGEVLKSLAGLPEFLRAYEPDGLRREEFITFGATQRTLSQFSEIGWKQLESFGLS